MSFFQCFNKSLHLFPIFLANDKEMGSSTLFHLNATFNLLKTEQDSNSKLLRNQECKNV